MDVDTPIPAGGPGEAVAGYKVVLQGVPFILSRDQCEYDSSNYFTSAFGGDFEESATRTIHIDRSPILFRFIVDHLSGYSVIPLPPIPSMRAELAIKNLLHDAQYFGLSKLEEQIQTEILEHFTKEPEKEDDPDVLRALGFGWLYHPDEGNIYTLVSMPDTCADIIIAPSDGAAQPPWRLGPQLAVVDHTNDPAAVTMHPDPVITLDGESAHWREFHAALCEWHRRNSWELPRPDATPIARALHRHLLYIKASSQSDGESGHNDWAEFKLYAEEMWVVPVRHSVIVLPDGTSRLQEVAFTLISAELRSTPALLRDLMKKA
ncbi:hypothetical protein RQP46_010929 [Phenoliferia psychrophenolica]